MVAEVDQALELLQAFASVGVKSFALTLTNIEGQKLPQGYYSHCSPEQLKYMLRPMLQVATAQQHNVIIRPGQSERVELVQLDDLAEPELRRLGPLSLVVLATSPGNGQSWVAVEDSTPGFARRLAETGVTAVSLDLIPRTLPRAQQMDALTSQANIAGYKDAVLAADTFGRFFPLLITAAGTARPARVLVLGTVVAGLQAIGTARRLGAVVSAYDVRPETKTETESLGATFIELTSVGSASGEGGYARALTEEERATVAGLAPPEARCSILCSLEASIVDFVLADPAKPPS